MNINIFAGREKKPTKEGPKGKNPSTMREPTQTEARANLKHPRQRDQRDHTTESHKIPTIEVHPTKTANKVEYQEVQKQTKRVTLNGETKEEPVIKRNG